MEYLNCGLHTRSLQIFSDQDCDVLDSGGAAIDGTCISRMGRDRNVHAVEWSSVRILEHESIPELDPA